MLNAVEILAYYDTLDMPLAISPSDSPLSIRGRAEGVSEREGYCYLFDREHLVPLCKERERVARRKWRIARRAAWWLRFVPFVRAVFASGSLSMNNTDELSDLDVVIIARHGHIWTTRLLVMGVLILLGKARRHEDRVAPDKICPNHFITDESLEIPFRSIYTAHLYSHLIPLIGDEELLKRFWKENKWIAEFTNPLRLPLQLKGEIQRGFVQRAVEWLMGPWATWLESKARAYQRQRIEAKVNVIKPGGHLVYNDNMLAFHLGSSEAEILRKYEDNKNKLTAGL